MVTTTSDIAYREIRRKLAENILRPGNRVSQVQLARQLDCSSVPVLEAMRRLESDGLLVKEPRKMARVRRLSRRDRQGLFLVREGLEAVAARMCAEQITDEQAAHLEELHRRYQATVDADDYEENIKLEIKMHGFIAEVADCPLLAEELERLLLIERTAGWESESGERQPLCRSDHNAVVQAIVDRDGDSAEYYMKKHILNAMKEWLARELKKEEENAGKKGRRRRKKRSGEVSGRPDE